MVACLLIVDANRPSCSIKNTILTIRLDKAKQYKVKYNQYTEITSIITLIKKQTFQSTWPPYHTMKKTRYIHVLQVYLTRGWTASNGHTVRYSRYDGTKEGANVLTTAFGKSVDKYQVWLDKTGFCLLLKCSHVVSEKGWHITEIHIGLACTQ